MRARLWPILRRVFGFDYADDQPVSKETRRGLTLFYWDAVFSQLGDASSANYVNLFLVALKASNTQIGFLATLTQILTALAPIPGALFAERSGNYRANVIMPALIARIGWFALALLPFAPLGDSVILIAIGLFGLRAFLMSWLTAPWTAFVGRLVPARLRASYFATRNFGSGIATIGATLAAGQIIGAIGFPFGYAAIFVFSGLMGLAACWLFARIPFERQSPAPAAASRTSTFSNALGLLRSQPQFARYLLCNCALALAVGIGGPFIQVYQVRELGFSAGAIGLLASLELGTNIVMQRVYGSLIMRRYGEQRVMRFLRFLTALVPFLWLFATTPAAGIPIVMLAGAIWSGHELANFNGLLNVTPEDGRANYIALHTFATALCAAVGPAIGGAVVDSIGFFPLFGASTALRAAAAMLLLMLMRGIAEDGRPRTADSR
jgi:predicted MFS family arabinose efflux permease